MVPLLLLLAGTSPALAQFGSSSSSTTTVPSFEPPTVPQAPPQSAYQGSVATQPVTPGVLQLTIKDAVLTGLKNNLGVILSGQNVNQAGGQRLQQLQKLLPTVNGTFKESVQQINLRAEGLNIPGFPSIIGPFAYTDVRGTVDWTLLSVPSLNNYLASRHDFEATKLSLNDARNLVALSIGYAYLACISDEANIANDEAQVASTKVSLDQATANHEAGTAPELDTLRARVDYQTQQQALIRDQNAYEKDKLALARAVGLPLEQKFELADRLPFAPLEGMQPDEALKVAYATRKDLQALEQQVKAAELSRKAATAERYPTVSFSGDYGDIGPTLGTSHGTFDAVGSASVPLFEEAKLRGDAKQAQAQLDTEKAQLSDLRGQIDADIRDAFLDLESAAKQVEVARSNMELAAQTLGDAQQRYAAGVSDNLAVVQAQASVAQANSQYVMSLYQHNVAKLSLARAMGVVDTRYQEFLGGK
ncbi:MAG TPA: TolC family protein [Acidobacteriaceae bacterium]|nr:TolC family protein [Acidobacteriaceae bacterium]